jgi:RNA polymerase sigma factor (sigma-70 family)
MPTAPASLMPALRRVIGGRGVAERSDAELLSAFVADRDPEAFAALVRRHGPMVLGVCRRVVRDPDAADDAFQAVFLVLARRADAVRPRGAVGGWLYGVAYRTALKARAVRARRRTREAQVEAMPEPAAPPTDDTWSDLKPILDEELARLPDRLRVPVVLCDLEGRPQRAVAGQLGIAPATLAGRLADARRTLAARLTRRGVAISAPALAALLAERGTAAVVGPALAANVVRAAEALAAGGAASGLVSDTALQLCDGVMRMFFLTKLKAAAATAVAVLVLAGGVGPGLMPAHARVAARVAAADAKHSDDAEFLDRICLDLRGSKATAVEHTYFAADADAGKRRKVAGWLLDAPAAAERTFTAVVNEALDADGPVAGEPRDRVNVNTAVKGVAVSGDGRFLAVAGDADWATLVDVLDGPPAVAPPPRGAAGSKDVLARFVGAPQLPAAEPVRVRVQLAEPARPPAPPAPPAPADVLKRKVVIVVDDGTGPKTQTFELPADPKQAGDVLRQRVLMLVGDGKGGVRAVGPGGDTTKLFLELVGQPDGAKAADGSFKIVRPLTGGKTVEIPQRVERVRVEEGKTVREQVDRVWVVAGKETDAAFLKRAVTEARGTPPTALEEKYFAADPDPRKREKLLDALLADPAALRRVGAAWKQRMLAPPAAPETGKLVLPLRYPLDGKNLLVPKGGVDLDIDLGVPARKVKAVTPPAPPAAVPAPPVPPAPVRVKLATPPVPPAPPAPPVAGDVVRTVKTAPAAPAERWTKLVADLIAAKKTDDQMLEAVTLAAAGRLPTAADKQLAQAVTAAVGDRAAGWTAVARALAGPVTTAPTPARVVVPLPAAPAAPAVPARVAPPAAPAPPPPPPARPAPVRHSD